MGLEYHEKKIRRGVKGVTLLQTPRRERLKIVAREERRMLLTSLMVGMNLR